MAQRKRSGRGARDDFAEKVKRVIADRVGGFCSRPDCMRPTKGPHSDDSKVTNIGKASHIHAAAKGGPRYDENQTAEQRKDATNGIWLCSDHAAEVDVDEKRFPADQLKEWKSAAEQAADVRRLRAGSASNLAGLEESTRNLLGWPQELPDGTWLPRPEIQEVRTLLASNDVRPIAVLGAPGSGKSAFLARLGADLRSEGWNVVAIKADLVPSSVATLGDLKRILGLGVSVVQALSALKSRNPTVLILDQLDALSDLADAKTERLAVLLSLVAATTAIEVPVVCSVREFDFQHDSRFMQLDAAEVRLSAVAGADIDNVLTSVGFDPGRASPKLKALLAIPQWLKLFMKLSWDGGAALPSTSGALLEALWQQKVLTPASAAAENEHTARHIADTFSDREELWVARAGLARHEVPLNRLLAAGILTKDASGMQIGFAHQTLYEFARARSFVGTESLLAYVVSRQGSLFVRPTIWMALHYLRAADPSRYRNELEVLWTAGLRPHLRLLLVEFLGQLQDPSDFEASLLFPRFEDAAWARVAFNATTRSDEWLRRLMRGTLQAAMSSSLADTTYGPVVALLKLQPDETLKLMSRLWGRAPEYAQLIVGVMRQLDTWTTTARDLLDGALTHVHDGGHLLDMFAWQLKEKSPAIAIELVVRDLERSFAQQESNLPQRSSLAPGASDEAQLHWHFNREPAKTIEKIFRAASNIHVLIELAQAEPESFLNGFLPWVAKVLTHAADSNHRGLSYRVEYICDCSRTEGPVHELPHALRTASEALARLEPTKFLELCTKWDSSDLHTIHVVLSYGREHLGKALSHVVSTYLLGDQRRLYLGEAGDHDACTLALLEAIRQSVSSEEVEQLEVAILKSQRTLEDSDNDAAGRMRARQLNREHRLRLLQKLPPGFLSPASRKLVEDECRIFGPDDRSGSWSTGVVQVGSPMSADQMARASDEHILGLFEELPDTTGFRHPSRILEGGAVEAGREFATFAKAQPERAIEIIGKLQPSLNEIPVADAISALADGGLPAGKLYDLIVACHDRGFASEQFRTDAARALAKRAVPEHGLPPQMIALLEGWLAAVPTSAGSQTREPPEDGSGPPFIFSHGGVYGLPGGSYAILDALLVALLSSKPPRAEEWLQSLTAHLARDDAPAIWKAFAHRLEWLRACDKEASARFLDAFFARYPEAMESTHGVELMALASWWVDPVIVRGWIKLLSDSSWRYAKHAEAELVTFLATRCPPDQAAETQLSGFLEHHASDEHALGVAHVLMGMWRDPATRARAGQYLCKLVRQRRPAVDAVVLKHLGHDELAGDLSSLSVLKALSERASSVALEHAHDLSEWLTKLIQPAPELVHQVVCALVEQAVATGEPNRRLGGASVQLVNIAVTLQRIPAFREQGLSLFERLLELDLYGARSTLDEIDFARREH
jgi:hypothetical protein